MRVGVLTGGGDCPGLNAVIRGIVRKGVPDYGYSFLGFRDGWRGPLEALTKPLDIPAVRGLLPRGGTILGSSRTNPFAIAGGVEKIKRNLQNLGVDALIAIGGEDTLGVATKLCEMGVNVVGVPKTIDNDLSGTDYTFGFDTAVNIAMEAIDRLHTTAESHHRALIVEVMGAPRGLDRAALRHGGRRERRSSSPRCGSTSSRSASGSSSGSSSTTRRSSSSPRGPSPRRARSRCSPARRTRSGTCGSAASATGSPGRSRRAPARRRAPPCSGTSSAAAPRPPATGGSPPASACTPSTRCAREVGPDGGPARHRHRHRAAGRGDEELKVVDPALYAEAEGFFG